MKTVSADEFKKQYGDFQIASPSQQPVPTPGLPSRISEAFNTRVQNAADEQISGASPEQKLLRTVGQGAAFIANDVPGAVIDETVKAIPQPVKELTKQELETSLNLIPQYIRQAAGFTGGILKAEAGIAASEYTKFKEKYPDAAKDVEAIFNISQIVPVERMLSLVGRGVAGLASNVAESTAKKVSSLFTRPATSVEDAILQADIATTRKASEATTPAASRVAAESTAPQTSLIEKWVGISPDIKRRIAGKQDKLQEYFDVAHARNADDTLPTPYEYGSKQAQNAVDSMESLLNESGGKIGQTRAKLGTYKATTDDVGVIESTFTDQLSKLNLEVSNGLVRQKPGTIAKVGSGDVKILNELYGNLQTLKESPTLTNIIDFRSALDSRINFGKRAAEVSSDVDPLSRQVRKKAADVAATIVGPEQAAEVQRFSDFMDAYNDLRSYTDRNAGGEYLLRLVLSGRGGEARSIIQTIKEYTGIDLMDDATMMTLATDFIGNTRQKNLFRQEVTKAGLDTASLLRGNPSGLINTILQFGVDKAIDPEKILLEAAKSSQ